MKGVRTIPISSSLIVGLLIAVVLCTGVAGAGAAFVIPLGLVALHGLIQVNKR